MRRSVPSTSFSSASCRSAIVTASWPRRAAISAASLTTLARSAPTIPAVVAARRSRSTSAASGTERVCTSRILRRPSVSGGCTETRRSNRPGRSSAGSSTSGRLVAEITITPTEGSKPSISVRIWLSVCSRSSCPPPNPPIAPARERPIASSSSMKMIAGAASLACWNRSRTRDAPDAHEQFDELRGRDREERHLRLPGQRPRQQRLARPGRAGEQHSARDPTAEPPVLVRVREEIDQFGQLRLGLVDSRDILEVDRLLGGLDALRP